MTRLVYTLLADGTSDRCLVRIIDWILAGLPTLIGGEFVPQVADLHILPQRPPTLSAKMIEATRLFPCDILFVHRDAEREPRENRLREIDAAAQEAQLSLRVPVVPVRMTEAWLLINDRAIRRAADNPNGTVVLDLPKLRDIESLPDPKAELNGLLISASEKNGRRLAQFKQDLSSRRGRVADLIQDFSPLLQLSAFKAFKSNTERVIQLWHKSRSNVN